MIRGAVLRPSVDAFDRRQLIFCEAGPAQHVQNEVRLAKDVALDVSRKLRRKLLLQLPVAARGVGLRAEEVADRNLVNDANRAFRTDVQIVPGQLYRMVERLAILNVEVPEVTNPRVASRSIVGGTSVRRATTTVISMIGFAASPGTDVLPTCSTRRATSATTGQILRRSSSNRRGQSSS